MKSKNFKKKLRLNKKNVADLNIIESKNVYGGDLKPPVGTRLGLSCDYIIIGGGTCGCVTVGGMGC